MANPTFGLIIGRFQPFHNGHLSLIKNTLTKCDKLILLVGSYRQARNIRNPFTYEERYDMIMGSLSSEEKSRIRIAPIRDQFYNEANWLSEVQTAVDECSDGSNNITLFGHNRDFSSYYLNSFPQWKFEEAGIFEKDISASDIRQLYFASFATNYCKNIWHEHLPRNVIDILSKFYNTDECKRLEEEFSYFLSYKNAWKDAPYPPTFVCTDCVVVKSAHILVVRRKAMPGKGLIALPGGFLQQDEDIVTGAIRELKEETSINIPKDQLHKAIVDQKVFGHPLRSLRGRTISHAFCINLGSGPLPKVRGGDDASQSWFMPLYEVYANEDKFFEDHAHIINYFCSRF